MLQILEMLEIRKILKMTRMLCISYAIRICYFYIGVFNTYLKLV
jgi:hypothetical protein